MMVCTPEISGQKDHFKFDNCLIYIVIISVFCHGQRKDLVGLLTCLGIVLLW